MTDEQLRQIICELTTSNISHIQATLLRQVIDLVSYSQEPHSTRAAEKKQPIKSCGTPWKESEKQLLRDRFDAWYSATSKKRKAICAELGKVVLRSPGGVDSMFKDIGKELAE